MNLKQLKYFAHIADLRSFTKAAALLNISQPALSRQITLLEEEVGTKLLHRRSHGVSLTLEGSKFLERCSPIISEHERLVRDYKERPRDSLVAGNVGIGVPVSLTNTFLDFVERFQLEHPGLRLRFIEGYSALLHEWLVLGSIDFAVIFGPRPSRVVDILPLAAEELYIIAPRQFGYPHLSTISARELDQHMLILPDRPHFLRDVMSQAGVAGAGDIIVDAFTLMVGLTRAGRGVTILPLSAIANDIDAGSLVALRLSGIRMGWEVSLSYSNLRPLSRVATLVKHSIQEEVARLIREKIWQAELVIRN